MTTFSVMSARIGEHTRTHTSNVLKDFVSYRYKSLLGNYNVNLAQCTCEQTMQMYVRWFRLTYIYTNIHTITLAI